MSSTAKGNAFEDVTHVALTKSIRDGSLGLVGTNCRLFKKKGYYSKDRHSEIIVDLSIELWLPDASSWSLLLACECKDYSGAIPVNDVEEFKSKLDQIAGKNVKGVMAVTGALQRSALAYARAHGIGVVRVLPNSQVSWVLYQGPVHGSADTPTLIASTYEQAITTPDFHAENQSFFGSQDGHTYKDWPTFLLRALQSGEP